MPPRELICNKRDWSWFGDFTKYQESVLIGTLLGDGSLNWPERSLCPRLRFGHGSNQIEWMVWKASRFGQLFNLLRPSRSTNSGGGISWNVSSRRHPVLVPAYNLFYTPHKVVTEEILEKVDDVALAVWWGDDGTAADFRMYLVLGGLEDSMYDLTLGWLESKGLSVQKVYRYSNSPHARKIKFTLESSVDLADRIRPHLPDCIISKMKRFRNENHDL